MKRSLLIAGRNIKLYLRDPLSLIFCLGFPVIMLVVMQLIFSGLNAEEVPMFQIENFAPGICVFGFTFSMLMIALYITQDKNSAFMNRILISPVKPFEYYFSFVLSGLPVCLCQTVIFYAVALIFGLKITAGLFISVLLLFPSALFYISCGLLIGAVCKSDTQAGPLSSIFITGAGLLGGVWMPLEQVGGTFLTVCKILPFYNTVYPVGRAVVKDFGAVFPSLIITLGYATAFFVLSAVLYKLKSRRK